MSRIFIDRPIFAWVLAIVVMLAGIGAIKALPVEQYPDIAPPQVNIRASYPGASAETIENSVTQILEQQLTGIDGLLYFSSTSSSRGQVNISAIFEKGTDPDIAQVQVQNQVQQAISRLPAQVQQQGVRVTKSNPDFLLIVGILRRDRPAHEHGYFRLSVVEYPGPAVARAGCRRHQRLRRAARDAHLAQSAAARRFLADAERRGQRDPAQNTEVAAGEVGGLPSPPGADAQRDGHRPVASCRRPSNSGQIVLKTDPSGASVRLKRRRARRAWRRKL